MDVTMPQLGETVTEGTLTRWLRARGDLVTEGEPLFEVSTDKVDTEVPAPVTGTLSELLVQPDQTVPVGTPLAVITSNDDAGIDARPAPADPPVEPAPRGAAAVDATARHHATPLIRRMLAEHGIDPGGVAGTGPDGRLTRADAGAAIAAVTATADPAPARPALTPAGAAPAAPPAKVATNAPNGKTAVPFTAIRRRIAEHMVRSKAVSPHTFMAFEVDFSAVDAVRPRSGTNGKSLTYLPFVARAVVDALSEFPYLNASVGDNELIVHQAVHLGIAVDLDGDGLVVPVLRNAADRRLPALARDIGELARRARAGELGVDDLAGGTFTISNPGPYGTLLTGAIINQPQVAILAIDTVRPRPVAVPYQDGAYGLTVHPVGNLSLSFDHRAIDGGYAARFLARTKQIIEGRDWSAEV